MKKYLALIIIIIIAAIGITVSQHRSTPSKTTNLEQPATKPTPKKAPGFDKTKYSTTDPSSIWAVVNKQHPLSPKNYVPGDLVRPNVALRVPGNESMQLRQATASSVEAMFADAKTAGLSLMLSSGYRSYDYQVKLYGGYVSSIGQASADTQSARPGYSEHQTGLALDIEPLSKTCELQQCFAGTPEGTWLVANAYKYGFLLRYTDALTSVTGYEGEPWHYRYVGVELATELHSHNVATLEQFFGVTGGTNY